MFSALVTWDSPMTNSHLVVSYTIILRKTTHAATVQTVSYESY